MNAQDRQIIRLMAWERAKGELNSMLQTFVNEYEQYSDFKNTLNEFIKNVEDNGKHE